MLDSNTDRSYFMIGAVIVGAAIIAGALFIFRDTLFGDDGLISKLINNMFGKAQEGINGIAPGTILPMLKGSLMSIFH